MNDEGMTKSPRPREEVNEAVWNDVTALKIREEPEQHPFTIWKNGPRGLGKKSSILLKAIPRNAVTNRIINMEERKK